MLLIKSIRHRGFERTNSMIRTGRLGICSSPSRNMGSERAPANAAGIMTSHLSLGIKSSQSPLGRRTPNIDFLPSFVFAASAPMRIEIEYTRSNKAKDLKAIVRAVGELGREFRQLESCSKELTYGNLSHVSRDLSIGFV